MENNKTPSIRFKGFTDPWEQRKLGDVIEKLTGGASIAPDDYVDVGYRTIPKGAVNSSGVADMSGCKNVSEIFFKKNISSKTSSGELVTSLRDLVPTAPNMGRIVRICGKTEDFLMPQGVYSIIVKEKNSEDFLIAYSNSPEYRKIIMAEKNGSTQVHIRNGEFLNIDIPLPPYEEQMKIGEYFKTLDNLITLHQRKYNKLLNVKKSMLEKMFPKNGSNIPEIRFKGFTDPWEQRKVLDLLELLTDYDANGSFADMAKNINTTDGDGYAWYVRITDLENPKPLSELKYVDESSYEFLKKTELHGGELLMAKRGNIGKVYIFEPRTKYATVAPNMYLLKLNNKVIPHFLYDYFVSEEGNKKLTRLNASSTMGALYKDDVKNIDVIMPSIEEQAMIGNFFQSIDHIITLHQRELEKLQNIKKSMLEKMFV